MKNLFLIITVLFLSSSLHAQIKAITEKGDTISVFENGTWELISNKKIDEKQPVILEERTEDELRKIIVIYLIAPHYREYNLGSADLRINWKNTSTKTIKYISFDVVPYNGVGDIVNDRIHNSPDFIGQITGPVKGGARRLFSYWNSAWYNKTIEKVKLVNIEIEYMDGSTIALSENEIEKVVNN